MSLIPYSSRDDSQSVVLRHQQTIVLYDPQSQQLALREERPPDNALELANCPYCHRPLNESDNDISGGESLEGEGDHGDIDIIEEPRFLDPMYFRMLQASIPKPPPALPVRRSPSPPHNHRHQQHARVDDVEESPSSSFYAPEERSRTSKISHSAFIPKYFERFFKVEKELGRGGSGVVMLVKHILDGVSLGHFACKRVPVGDDHSWLEKVLNEVQLLQQLSHQNLVSYRHVWLEDMELGEFQPSVPCAFILQQYCNGGDLHNYVLGPRAKVTKEMLKERIRRKSRGQPDISQTSPRRRLSFGEIISFFRDIASGLNHLHKNKFIHRDLKPSNCLLHDTGLPGAYPRVLLSDFGEVQKENASRRNTGATGTISYCAPEVLRRVGPNGEYSNFTPKSDVFALGLILYFMCFNKLPYAAADEENEENEDIPTLRAEISQWRGLDLSLTEMRSDLPDQLYVSLKTLLSPNPDVRPSAEEILRQLEIFDPEFTADIPHSSHSHPRTPKTSRFRTGPAAIPRVARSLGSKTANGGALGTARSNSVGAMDEDFRRISPIADTPPTANTPVNGRSKNAGYPLTRHSRLRGSLGDITSVRDRSSPSDLNGGYERDSPSSVPMDRSQSLDSSSSIVVRRRRGSSGVALNSNSPGAGGGGEEGRIGEALGKVQSPRLMPPPETMAAGMGLGMSLGMGRGIGVSRRTALAILVSRPEVVNTVKLAVFLFKLFTIYRPCSPLAPNPWINCLLLGIAVFDFASWFYSKSILLLVIHLSILLLAGTTGQLCPY